MFVPTEVLRYAGSLIVGALSFLLVRAIRNFDKLEARVEAHDIAIAEIRASIEVSNSASAVAGN